MDLGQNFIPSPRSDPMPFGGQSAEQRLWGWIDYEAIGGADLTLSFELHEMSYFFRPSFGCGEGFTLIHLCLKG